MAFRYTKTSRRHLKAHDAGYDRHHKGMAYDHKKARLEAQHQTERSTRRSKKDA